MIKAINWRDAYDSYRKRAIEEGAIVDDYADYLEKRLAVVVKGYQDRAELEADYEAYRAELRESVTGIIKSWIADCDMDIEAYRKAKADLACLAEERVRMALSALLEQIEDELGC